jgi:hypothetical protein
VSKLARALIVCGLAAIAASPAHAVRIADPIGAFTDSQGNAGYIELGEDGLVFRACNENHDTPAGDDVTGYVWVNPGGENTTPSYGNTTVGAGDDDGDGAEDGDDSNGTEGDDCP